MASTFPTTADNIRTDITNATPEVNTHPTLHNDLAFAINAIETTLITGSGAVKPVFAAGTAAAPSITFAADPNTGFWNHAADEIGFSTGGTNRWYIPLTGYLLPEVTNTYDVGTSALRPRTIYAGTSVVTPLLDTPLLAPTSNVIEQRNGTNAQTLRIYNTTDAPTTNYERIEFAWQGWGWKLQTWSGGTGAARILWLGTSGAADVALGTASVTRWTVSGATGHLYAQTDNTVDFGAAGSNRPRTIYAGTSVVTPALVVSAAPAFAAGDRYLVVDASGNVHKSAIGPAS